MRSLLFFRKLRGFAVPQLVGFDSGWTSGSTLWCTVHLAQCQQCGWVHARVVLVVYVLLADVL
jgi:hypothetical protein